jgi:hypothetical protein
MTFGLTSGQLDKAGSVLQQLASSWIELVAGSEGYLTAPGRAGLDKQAVVWGEMVGNFLRENLFTMVAKNVVVGHNGVSSIINQLVHKGSSCVLGY